MIILDTNVVSELMRPAPTPAVARWADGLDRSIIFSTSISTYEIEYGIARLPASQKKDFLVATWAAVLADYIGDRILSLDRPSALRAAHIRAQQLAAGENCDICDVFISGIASHHGAAVATRNVHHFINAGLNVINPWDL